MSELGQVVEGVVQKVEQEVKSVVERARVDLEDADKFVVSQIENTFLKTQVEAQQIQKRLEDLQKNADSLRTAFVSKTEELAKKYSVDLKDFVYNAVEFAFTKKPAEQK